MLWLLWKRTRNPASLAFVGLNPLVAISVVNGGHPDALVALGVLVAVLLAIDRRPVAAGLAFGLAASVNFTALVGAGVLCVWAYRRWTRGEVVKFAAIVGVVGVLPYLLLSGWLQNAHQHSGLISRQSIWNAIGSGISNPDLLRTLASNGTTIIAGALLLVIAVRHTSRGTPELAIAAGLASFLVASSWVMPWYAFTALPLLALRRPNLLSWTVALYSSLVLLGEQYPSLSAGAVGSLGHQVLQNLLPIAAFGVLRDRGRVPAARRVGRRARRHRGSRRRLRPNQGLQHRRELLLRLGPFRGRVGSGDDPRTGVDHRVRAVDLAAP